MSKGKEVLDLVTSIDIIEAVESSPYRGDCEFLNKALGEETALMMHVLGYFTIGFYLDVNTRKTVKTYKVTERYKARSISIKRERNSLRFLYFFKKIFT